MWDHLKETDRPILLYGMGNASQRILNELKCRGIEPQGIFASDTFVRGQFFCGYKVMSYAEAKDRFGDFVILLCFGTHRQELIEHINTLAEEQDLYAPDIPVIGEGIFDRAYREQNRSRLEEVRSLLADEKSREVFDGVIRYKLSGKLEHLYKIQTSEDEDWRLLDPGPSEIYMDLGAYNGDTVLEFARSAGQWQRIIAVEPDAKTMKKLRANTRHLKDIEYINAAIDRSEGRGWFLQGSGRGGELYTAQPPAAIEGRSKLVSVDIRSVDGILNGKPLSLLKMDVEGLEGRAIEGAARTIEQYRPRIHAAAYHRLDDLWAIPLQILKIRPDYKVYFRHGPCIPGWELNYIFI